MSEIELKQDFDLQNDIVSRYLKGELPRNIGRQLGLTTPQINEVLDGWRKIAVHDTEVKYRAREALAVMDEHYNLIIKKLWDTVDQADLNDDLKTKNSVLKNIADIEAKRLDSLNKAGLLDSQKLGDQIAVAYETFEKVKTLLKDLMDDCDHCKIKIAQAIRTIFNEAATIKINGEAE